MSNIQEYCNTCGCKLDVEVCRQSHGDHRFLATIINNTVVQECCDPCAQEAMEEVEDD